MLYKKNIYSLSLEELETVIENFGEKKFRGKQVYEWLHKKHVELKDASNLPISLVEKLKENYEISMPKISLIKESKLDETKKFLLMMRDGSYLECVLMKYEYGYSLCISTQIGCRMGCKFCASTLDGLERNLEKGEMLSEIYVISNYIKEKISHIVLMGMGEPLDNYENVVEFVKEITNEKGYNLSIRNITISTCGIVPNIYKLAKEKLPITLAVSLHSPIQEVREEIMPVARAYDLEELFHALDYYYRETKRRITYEYALIEGKNSTKEDGDRLIKLLSNRNAHINLIPVNNVVEREMKRPSKKCIYGFLNYLEKNNITASIRREQGSDIDGACGQLRRKVL